MAVLSAISFISDLQDHICFNQLIKQIKDHNAYFRQSWLAVHVTIAAKDTVM